MCHIYLIIVLAVLATCTVLYYFWPYAILALALLLSPLRSQAAPPAVTLHPIPAEFFDALRKVESSDRGGKIYGDNGWAIGPYQIHYDYWCDATQYFPELGQRPFTDCQHEWYARWIVTAYLNRWCACAVAQGDYYTMARIHNGGPHGADHATTRLYGHRVIRMIAGAHIEFSRKPSGLLSAETPKP